MKLITTLLTTLILCSCANKTTEQNNPEVEILKLHEMEKLFGGFKFTEGPAVDKDGNVYFTDIPNNLILIWTLENKLDTFREKSGGANGLFFDKDQNLITCEGEKGQITSMSPDKELTILTSEFEGNRYNKPNDLWVDAKGGVYFTDPFYGGDESNLPQGGMHVYYIKPDRKTVIKVINDYEKPNGVIGTPDGKNLYVTDAKGKRTWKYNIEDDGTLSNKTLFAEVGCDGMTIDIEGNLYLTNGENNDVEIYSPDGKLIQSINCPEKPSNVCFGGKDRKQLFITARTSVYRIELDRQGVN